MIYWLYRLLSAGKGAGMNYYNASGQMDLSDRIAIETGICIGESFKKIAKRLRRHFRGCQIFSLFCRLILQTSVRGDILSE